MEEKFRRMLIRNQNNELNKNNLKCAQKGARERKRERERERERGRERERCRNLINIFSNSLDERFFSTGQGGQL